MASLKKIQFKEKLLNVDGRHFYIIQMTNTVGQITNKGEILMAFHLK